MQKSIHHNTTRGEATAAWGKKWRGCFDVMYSFTPLRQPRHDMLINAKRGNTFCPLWQWQWWWWWWSLSPQTQPSLSLSPLTLSLTRERSHQPLIYLYISACVILCKLACILPSNSIISASDRGLSSEAGDCMTVSSWNVLTVLCLPWRCHLICEFSVRDISFLIALHWY